MAHRATHNACRPLILITADPAPLFRCRCSRGLRANAFCKVCPPGSRENLDENGINEARVLHTMPSTHSFEETGSALCVRRYTCRKENGKREGVTRPRPRERALTAAILGCARVADTARPLPLS